MKRKQHSKTGQQSHIAHEKRMVLLMICIYSRHHLDQRFPHRAMRELAWYCFQRLDRCRYGEQKGPCKRCKTHCYRPDRRAQIRQVMRWSGPRVFFLAPREAIRHAL